jgi:hypothetical protein
LRYYCTYFDHRYLPKGLALLESLRAHATPFELWIFCLDEACHAVLRELATPELQLVRLSELENWAPDLSAAKATRSLIEFYFTLTPFLPRFVMAHRPEANLVTYVDSDLYFFTSPESIFTDMGDAPAALIEHRFRPALRDLERWGKFNVGFLPFRSDPRGLRILDWWRDRCVEWCFDRLEGDRFADQKYLDVWPNLFPEVHVVQNIGANVGPWNVGNYTISRVDGRTHVDDTPLCFYHFHALKRIAPWIYDPNLHFYATSPSAEIRKLIYEPYLRALGRAEQVTHRWLANRTGPSSSIRERQEPAASPLARLVQKQHRLRASIHQARRGDFIYFAAGRAL